jgi:phosphopantothenoylcysteine decarboxylase/phosphopantothenate--cysteine ligase
MAAAVSNFRPKADAIEKLKRGKGALSLDLVENPDILAELGAKRGDEKRPILVGFSIETGEIDELLAKAREKIERKRVDMLVGHYAEDAYDLDANRAWLVDKGGKVEEVATSYKSRVANKILDRILKL